MGEQEKSSFAKKALRRVGTLVALACLILLVRTLWRNLDSLPPVIWTAPAIAAVVGAILVGPVLLALRALAWTELLRAGRPSLSLSQSFRILGRSSIAKYLPGNVFHLVGRVVLARSAGLGTRRATLSMLADTWLLLLTAGVVGLPALVVFGAGRLSDAHIDFAGTVLVVAAVVAGAVIALVLFRARVVSLLREAWGFFKLRPVVLALVLNTAGFCAVGAALFLLSNSLLPEVEPASWLGFTCGYSLAWALGFVTPGAPGGIGVREAVLYLLFEPVLGAGVAAGLFLVLRAALTVGDFLGFAISMGVPAGGAAEEDRS